jgi:hypothetical protein
MMSGEQKFSPREMENGVRLVLNELSSRAATTTMTISTKSERGRPPRYRSSLT